MKNRSDGWPELFVREKNVDYRSRENRIRIAKRVMRLFQLWQLRPADQLSLLGLSPHSRSSLNRYRSGHPVAHRKELIQRIGLLFSMYESLSRLFSSDRDSIHRWITSSNTALGRRTPLAVMLDGIDGMKIIDHYLHFQIYR
ncbi:antitoxin Xre/MbcA/ParS toxin-binding domain-containing protein [Geobacter anodireducens]